MLVEDKDENVEGIENNDNVLDYNGEKEAIDCKKAVFPAKMNGRTIRNAHLYNIVRKMINDCMRTCGLSSYIVS